MNDLISREDAIKAVKFYETFCDPYPRVIEALEKLPSVQPKERCIATITLNGEDIERIVKEQVEEIKERLPRKGKWIYGEHDVAMCDGYRCDRCGFFVPWDYQHKFIDFINEYNFCPNCGFRMEEGDSDN